MPLGVFVIITHADGSRRGGVGFYLCLYLSVFPHDISKIDAAMITVLDLEMFYDESWKCVYFGVKMSKIKVTSHKNIAGVGLCTLASAGFF